MAFNKNISFIIPCKNEEKYIATCLDSIIAFAPEDIDIEIIVVDNGSEDGTINIIKQYADQVDLFIAKDVSISELRNIGAQKSHNDWLAFIDADVELCENWLTNLFCFIDKAGEDGVNLSQIITGSTYNIPYNPTWIEKSWFLQLSVRDTIKNTYINGGNLIIHSDFFWRIGGFDTSFNTGEDVKLCCDAVKEGGEILKKENIRSIHHGYPKTIPQFFNRERWHGLSIKNYIMKPWEDKTTALAFYNIIVVCLFLILILLKINIVYALIFFLFFVFGPLLIFTYFRAKGSLNDWVKLYILFLVYSLAKSFALIDILIFKKDSAKGRDSK